MPLETSVAVAAALMSFTVNSVPIEARLMNSSGTDGCSLASERARAWRTGGKRVVEQRIGGWCVVGTVIDQHWVAEQWSINAGPRKARGWRVRIPIKALAEVGNPRVSPWPLDIADTSINTRTRLRRSSLSLEEHHSHSRRLAGMTGKDYQRDIGLQLPGILITRSRSGSVLVSGSEPAGESYSVLIDRHDRD